MGAINVIHGPNNVGKSNLLQSIQLFFALVRLRLGDWLPVEATGAVEVGDVLREYGHEPAEIFNLEKPAPIRMAAQIEIEEQELVRAGLEPSLLPDGQVGVSMELYRAEDTVWYQVRRFAFSDGSDAASMAVDGERRNFVRQFVSFLSQDPLFRTRTVDRFAMIGIERLSTSDLALALYDAKESADLEQARRWERFREAMSSFKDILGDGVFVATYDRKAQKASLFYQTSFARIPLRLLGSGVQQIVSLIGHLLITNATLVAIEEPELNLRYTLQERLRDVFSQKLVGALGGPSQLFLTSHSPAFESGPHFYLMEPTPTGPMIEARNVELARAAVGFPEDVVPPGVDAARCYLSTEGVVRVPENIRRELGLLNGGGVMFLKRDGHVEMMSDERFAAMLDVHQDDKGDEQA
ncbi:ATP-binding protein [Archangium sp. Cb G35]|uniref:ATP-binding protein n=1 Tax=Archangium sp. Cb G35 TaxID=1920190 RepID=UPI000A8493B5|nr:ATP-binding protein [Archangium sp. Cb G35]